MSHFVAYILQFQEIIVYKIPPGGGGGSIASLRSTFTALGFMPIDRIRNSEELSEFSSYFEKTYIGYFKKQTQKVLRLLY